MPAITVLLPVYNGAGYLKDAVTSVLGQSFRDFELLIIDDGSTDETPSIIERFDDQRVRYVRHELNRRLIATLNEGLAMAKGKYVARMDADDVCHPKRLEMQERFLEAHPDVGVVGTAVRSTDGEGRYGPVYRFPERHDVIMWALSFVCPLAHPSVMMRRNLVLSAGGYAASALHAEDYDLWERLSTGTRFANLPQALLNLRKHDASLTVREAAQYATAARTVSARCMSARIGRPVSEAVAACLMRDRSCNTKHVLEAAHVLMKLYEGVRPESEATRVVVRRDAAMRLAMLAVEGGRGWMRLELARHATRIDPSAWTSIGWRVVRRLTGWGVQRLVG